MNQDIEQAIDAFRCRAAKYAKNERYYRGDHDLAFATEKFENAFGSLFREFAMNLCPAICDAVKDKLRITNFGVASVRSPTEREGAANQSGALAHTRATDRDIARDADPAPRDGAVQAGSLRSHIDRIWSRNRMQQRAAEIHKE